MRLFKRKPKGVQVRVVDKRCWWVVIENGRASMYDPNGVQLYAETECVITDSCVDLPRAKFEALVNIAPSKEAMMSKIKETVD